MRSGGIVEVWRYFAHFWCGLLLCGWLCRPVPLTLSPPLVAPRAFSATALLRLAMPYGIRGSIVVHLPARWKRGERVLWLIAGLSAQNSP